MDSAAVRMVLGIIGSLLVLAAALLMAIYVMATEWLPYPGLVLIIAIAIWDLMATNRTADADNLTTPIG